LNMFRLELSLVYQVSFAALSIFRLELSLVYLVSLAALSMSAETIKTRASDMRGTPSQSTET